MRAGDTEHRSAAYLKVREHSSTGSTNPQTFEGWGYESTLSFLLLLTKFPATYEIQCRWIEIFLHGGVDLLEG
ncbi:MAG: palindromic element RPE1 domain-containing protein [Holosporales bacterium]|nr:palindromic element RPE1 domain-containing protein [Holosporales bacterium]